MISVDFKAGDTFYYHADWEGGSDGPPDLTAAAISSGLRTRDGVYHALSVTTAGDGLSFVVRSDSTSGWVPGTAQWDIKIVNAGIIVHTDTILVNITAAVTP